MKQLTFFELLKLGRLAKSAGYSKARRTALLQGLIFGAGGFYLGIKGTK